MITSTRNRQVLAAARLKKRALRDRERRFLVEGLQVAAEALGAGALEIVFHAPEAGGRLGSLLEAARASGVEVRAVSPQVMDHLSSTVTSQGVVGVARLTDRSLSEMPAGASLVPVLCSVRDPGNAGTIVRSADAAGAAGVVFTEGSVDPYNPKAVRASAGSLFHLPVMRNVSPAEAVYALRALGIQILAAAADGEVSIYDADFSRPSAVLFGNEAWGLEPEVRSLADHAVRVPIHGGAESLNLASAAALVLFESARAREEARRPAAASATMAAMIAAAAHDLRSPLAALTGLAATLASKWDRIEAAQRVEMLDGIALDGHRIAGLLRLLLDVVRLEAGVPEAESGERADAGEAAEWVSDVVARGGERPRLQGAGRRAPTILDRERLRAVLLALCDGALWWGTAGAPGLLVSAEDQAVLVVVRRAGEGPTPEEAARMFSAPDRGGRVGLYLAHRVVTALGGALSCEAGDGVTFTLRLPSTAPPRSA